MKSTNKYWPYIILGMAAVMVAIIVGGSLVAINQQNISLKRAQEASKATNQAQLDQCLSKAYDDYRLNWDNNLKHYGNGKDQSLSQNLADQINAAHDDNRKICLERHNK